MWSTINQQRWQHACLLMAVDGTEDHCQQRRSRYRGPLSLTKDGTNNHFLTAYLLLFLKLNFMRSIDLLINQLTHRPASFPWVTAVFRFCGIRKRYGLICSLACQDMFLRAEIPIIEYCLPREKKLKWIPPNVTTKPASDTQDKDC
jgi:hypothetical protein